MLRTVVFYTTSSKDFLSLLGVVWKKKQKMLIRLIRRMYSQESKVIPQTYFLKEFSAFTELEEN